MKGEWSLKLFLVRHGETDWNKARRYQGRQDTSLNATGREQARLAGEKLKEFAPAALYASSLNRTMETAEIIGKIIGLCPQSEPRLQEIHFGEWEGRTYPEVLELFPLEVKMWRECPLETIIPGGETLKDVLVRTLDALNDIIAEAAGDVVVVTHGGPIRLLLCHMGSEGAMWHYPVKPGSITVVAKEGDKLALEGQL